MAAQPNTSMKRIEAGKLIGRLLMGSLLIIGAACNYNYGPQPGTLVSNQRLKRLVYVVPIGIGVTTDYAYDQSGRLSKATYTGDLDYISNPTPDGPPYALYTYDGDNRLTAYDYRYAVPIAGYTSEVTSFTNAAGSTASATYKMGPNKPSVLLLRTVATFTDSRIATFRRERFAEGAATNLMLGKVQNEEYTYSGTNIASTRITGDTAGYEQTYVYTYDDRPNPLRGIYGPDITPVRRYSQNNTISVSSQEKDGLLRPSYTSTYEYGSNRLPTKATSTGITNLFEYESY